MSIFKYVAVAMVLVLPRFAFAEDLCDNTFEPAEMEKCSKEAEAELDQWFAEAIIRTKSYDDNLPSGQKVALSKLQSAQKAWLAFRDDECVAESMQAGDDADFRASGEYFCRWELTKARSLTLMVEMGDND